jgi:hypothetical protein
MPLIDLASDVAPRAGARIETSMAFCVLIA